jgi:hypothetical protein
MISDKWLLIWHKVLEKQKMEWLAAWVPGAEAGAEPTYLAEDNAGEDGREDGDDDEAGGTMLLDLANRGWRLLWKTRLICTFIVWRHNNRRSKVSSHCPINKILDRNFLNNVPKLIVYRISYRILHHIRND